MSAELWLLLECERCGAIGMADRPMAHNECSALREWHRWFDEHPDRPIDEENPVEIPHRLIEVEPVKKRLPLVQLLGSCKQWRAQVEADELAQAYPSRTDHALFDAIDKADGKT